MKTPQITLPAFPRALRFLPAALVCAVGALFLPHVRAQGKEVVHWSGALSRPAARPGEKIAVKITAAIPPGYHIYGLKPGGDGPVATEITVSAKGLTAVGKPVEPKPLILNDPSFGKIPVHENAATFAQTLLVPKGITPTTVPVTASVTFEACTDKSCLPPKTVSVAVPALKIETGAARKPFVATAGDASGDSGGGLTAVTAPNAAPMTAAPPIAAVAPVVAPVADTGLGAFLAAAFGAGLVALVTPCVFPLIPVTLAFFTKQAAAKNADETAVRGGVVRFAAIYSLGIVLAFTAIGAVLSATVGAAGANRLASNPFVNLAFGVLFIVFALSLLEVIELRPPAALQKLTAGGAGHAGTTLGVLGMGLTFVIAAFTCTAPFIGTVLVAAASAQTGGQWVRPILGMATFAAALALPFFVLALFPALLARLPKSGAWLSTVKGAMGWIELAAAVKFLSGADQVFGWRLLNQSTILALWAITFLAGGAWLLGTLRIGFGAPEGKPTPLRAGFAALFLLIGGYCVYGLSGRPLDGFTVAYLPPSDYGVGANLSGELTYLPSIEAGIAEARATGKPIFVDFTGYTCTNCQWMERNVFVKAPVPQELDHFVRVRLYTDNRQNGEALQQYQEKTFGTIALPLYAVLDAQGKSVVSPVGKTDTPEEFARFLRAGRESAAGGAGSGATVARNR